MRQIIGVAEEIVTDEQLMLDVQQGDTEAFDRLVLRYHQDAIRLAYYYIGNWEDARDLSQDAFVKVYQQADLFDATQAFRPWFFRILVNHTLNFIKRKKRIRFFSIFDQNGRNDEMGPTLADRLQEPGDREADFFTYNSVWSALEKLSQKHRSVLVLHDIEGLKETEVAHVLNCSVGTVKSRLHYARKKIRKFLEKDFE